ncbi:uncharacterized protein METZ01_LOCUS162900 [marine metagenome]|uniref:Uncharacterized protein n=1 Tax=marine metagenome TaxID=408172 RepID=A0A382B8D3_9ZZZZ
MMADPVEVNEIDIDGRTFWVRPVGSWVLQSNNVVAETMAISLDKPLEWAVGFFFGNVELSLELWTTIAGISGFDD